MSAKKFAKGSPSDGSALILTVVLTSLLAMVGVLFVMMARVNQIATSGISESRELDSAIETAIAKISEELVLDVPGVAVTEYYDYPDANNAWLASLEPYDKPGVGYCWRHISDVTGFLNDKNFDTQDVDVDPPGIRKYIQEYPEISVDSDGEFLDEYGNPATEGLWADADGDGVADSKWVEVNDITSSKGKPIYAAIRIIDNGGMLNVNTAYKFDPNDLDVHRIDGSSQMQINLMGLSERDQTHTSQQKIDRLWSFRAGSAPNDVSSYEQNVVWQYGNPTSGYIPFDISDEMKLRNRYLLNYNKITTRIEKLWTNAYDGGPEMPLPTDDYKLNRWLDCAAFDLAAPNDYDYRHISATYNMDRIIRPDGGRMLNINHDDPNVNVIYNAIRAGLIDGGITDPNSPAAQITVNLIDFRDNDSNVTSINVGGSTYYGFEQPCVYISELAHRFVEVFPPGGPIGAPTVYRSYAIELYKPYSGDDDPNDDWRLMIGVPAGGPIGAPPVGNVYGIDWSSNKQFHVIRNENPNAQLPLIDSDVVVEDSIVFDEDSLIQLQRRIDDVNGVWITVDSKYVPDANNANGWLAKDGIARGVQRDITPHKCIRRLWDTGAKTPTLGSDNSYENGDLLYIQAHPANTDFTNVGEIGMIFRKGAYYYERGERFGRIGYGTNKTEDEVRIDLTEPYYQNLFQYVTVLDPASDGIDNDGDTLLDSFDLVGPEWKVPGRININTAPWYVLAQLPWMQYQDSNSIRAKAICNKRDETSQQGFWNIGELMLVDEMRLGADGFDQVGFPDLTTPDSSSGDGAMDAFEERDLIFARISNLVTVRSDVFTAYILVRIGTDGPQKRVIAILDRSDVYSPTDRVKIVAVHPVADPR